MVELASAAVFIASAGSLVWIVREKLALLSQVPDQLIEESFRTRPSRLGESLRRVMAFIREGRIREFAYAWLIRLLGGMRLRLLRCERLTYRAMESLKERGRVSQEVEARYWNTLKTWKQNGRGNGPALPETFRNPDPPPPASGHPPG